MRNFNSVDDSEMNERPYSHQRRERKQRAQVFTYRNGLVASSPPHCTLLDKQCEKTKQQSENLLSYRYKSKCKAKKGIIHSTSSSLLIMQFLLIASLPTMVMTIADYTTCDADATKCEHFQFDSFS